MSNAIHRYEIPVDNSWHTITLAGSIVHIASRRDNLVEIWAHTGGITHKRTYRVYGTGDPVATEDACTRPVHVGTAITPGGRFVWHLFELERVGAGAQVFGEPAADAGDKQDTAVTG